MDENQFPPNIQKESQPSFLSRYLFLIILVVIASLAGAGIIYATNNVSKEIEELKVKISIPDRGEKLKINQDEFQSVQSFDTDTDTDTDIVEDSNQDNIDFKECSAHTVWRCEKVTEGEYDSEKENETVCGCVPDCRVDTFLVTSPAEGKWPDNTDKGKFECSDNPPS